MNIPLKANYIAHDADGRRYWYERRPWMDGIQWRPSGGNWGYLNFAGSAEDWQSSLVDIRAEAECSLA